jgi:hypothetical protein
MFAGGGTLAWAITGLCLTHTVRLGACAQVLSSRAQDEALRVRRFSRWFHHPALSPAQWYQPVLQAALVDWPVASRLDVATSYNCPHSLCAQRFVTEELNRASVPVVWVEARPGDYGGLRLPR